MFERAFKYIIVSEADLTHTFWCGTIDTLVEHQRSGDKCEDTQLKDKFKLWLRLVNALNSLKFGRRGWFNDSRFDSCSEHLV
jgi:hypothetical protein